MSDTDWNKLVAEHYKGIWRYNRRGIGRLGMQSADFYDRNNMRAQAHSYAQARGWKVALTPPQRRKVMA